MKVLLTLCLIASLLTDLSAQMISFSTECSATEFCTDDINCDLTNITLNAEATTTCATGNLSISYAIDLNDDGTIDETGTTNTIDGDYDLGTHRVIFTAMDDCGNEETCEYLFSVLDCTPPSPNVFVGLAFECEGIEGTDLLAIDFNFNSSDNCGITEMLLVSPSQGSGQLIPPAEAASFVNFTGENIGTNTVDFWVSDAAGNWSYISSYIVFQDNLGLCGDVLPDAQLCVYAETECGEAIENVTVNFDYIPGIPDGVFTSDEPCMELPFIGSNNLVVQVSKDDNPLNGISAFDLVLMIRHILGIEHLDSPYKIISADVNNSGTVTTLDIVELRKVILFISDSFSNNTSWRFVDADFIFPNPANPFQSAFPEICSINEIVGTVEKSVIGMKIGDVNKSADPTGFTDAEPDYRSTRLLNIQDRKFESGEKVAIDFYAEDLESISGFQFALNFDTRFLSFEGFQSETLENFNASSLGLQHISKGEILACWINTSLEKTEVKDKPLFTLFLWAKQSGQLGSVFQLNPTKLSPEIYSHDLNISNLALQIAPPLENLGFQERIAPNPFQKSTTLQVESPEAIPATLTILNLDGQVLKTIQQNLEKGNNTIELNETIFPTSSIYFYQITTEKYETTGKIMKL